MLVPENGEIAPKISRQRGMDSSLSSLKDQKKVISSDSCSSAIARSRTMLVPENGEIAPKISRQRGMDSSRSSLKDQKKVISSDSCHERFDDKRKYTTPSEIAAKNVKSTSEIASSAMHSKKPVGEHCSVHIERDKLSSNHHN